MIGPYSRDGSRKRIVNLSRPYTGGLAFQPRGGDGLCPDRSGERHGQKGGDQIKSGGGIQQSFHESVLLLYVCGCFSIPVT
ncbi:MAG: hypothetical protein OXC57_01215 [Rhodobacteraceae bacterium]|nr:hypothetical protein [Paracoccaceae bacterium]